MSRLSVRERRLVAVLILAALLALAWLLIVAPIRAGFAERQLEREALLLTYARNERIIGTMRQWRAVLAEQRKTAGLFTISAKSPELAASALRDRVVKTARAVGVTQASAAEVPVEDGRIGLRADLVMSVGQLEAFLKQLQNERPLLVVESLAIDAEPARLSNQAEPMEVRLELSAAYDLAAAQ